MPPSNHERDSRLTFVDKTHTYTLDGNKECISVTTLIGCLFREFDPDVTLADMKRRGTFYKGNYEHMTEQEVKDMWERNSERAASHGTRMHALLEDFFDGKLISLENSNRPEFKEFSFWWNGERSLLKPYKTEWRMFDEDHVLAGTVDMLFELRSAKPERDANGPRELIMYDWKFARKMHLSAFSYDDTAFGPGLSHLSNCNFIHYAIQLSLYRYILEKNYNVKILAMYLLHIQPDGIPDMWDVQNKKPMGDPKYEIGTRHKVWELKYLKEEVECILANK